MDDDAYDKKLKKTKEADAGGGEVVAKRGSTDSDAETNLDLELELWLFILSWLSSSDWRSAEQKRCVDCTPAAAAVAAATVRRTHGQIGREDEIRCFKAPKKKKEYKSRCCNYFIWNLSKFVIFFIFH